MEQSGTLLIMHTQVVGDPHLEFLLQGLAYRQVMVANARELIKANLAQPGDLILLVENGAGGCVLETCRFLRQVPSTQSIPVLLLLEQPTHESILRSLEAGADDCLGIKADKQIFSLRVDNLVKRYRHQRRRQEERSIFQLFNQYPDGILIVGLDLRVRFANRKFREQILGKPDQPMIEESITTLVHHAGFLKILRQWLETTPAMAGKMAAAEEVLCFNSLPGKPVRVEVIAGYVDWGGELALQFITRQANQPAKESAARTAELNVYDLIIEGWAQAVREKDHETAGHSLRVTEWSEALARRMGVSEEEISLIRRGAMLHDIGKLGIPEHILNKPGPLDEQEWEIMRQHPEYARQMISPILYLEPAVQIPYYHHEHWDGSGYPHGLEGENIPLAARLFSVVDVWDALNSDRPYRKAWSREKALDYIQKMSGVLFDPRVVEAFLAIVNAQPQNDKTGPIH